MPMHSCMGINELKLLHELAKCLLLLWRACVLGRFSVLGHTTDIADANTVGIMPQAMGANAADAGMNATHVAVRHHDVALTAASYCDCCVHIYIFINGWPERPSASDHRFFKKGMF